MIGSSFEFMGNGVFKGMRKERKIPLYSVHIWGSTMGVFCAYFIDRHGK